METFLRHLIQSVPSIKRVKCSPFVIKKQRGNLSQGHLSDTVNSWKIKAISLRQETLFRKDEEYKIFHPDNYEGVLKYVEDCMSL